MNYQFAFNIGDHVTHALDNEARGIVTGISIRPHGTSYQVTWKDMSEKPHYEMELRRAPVGDSAKLGFGGGTGR